MKKLLAATGLRSENWVWRVFSPVSCSLFLLTFLFVYDRSFIYSAVTVLHKQFTPLFSSYQSTVSAASPPDLTHPLFSGCNIFEGKWVFDDTYPLYTSCHLAESAFQCHANGRPDRNYQKWRWQPHECSIPRFDAKDMLGRLQGLRVVIVGDSLGRTQWESLNCLLLQAVSNKSSVQMIYGPITNTKVFIRTRFNDHNVTIDYYKSSFLVTDGQDVPQHSPKRVQFTLKLTKVDQVVARNIVDADILVINTGHWWFPEKTFDVGRYFQVKEKLMLGMPVITAYEKAVRTIISWVEDHVNFNRTEVFFRSYEPSHWLLPMATEPYSAKAHPTDNPRARIWQTVRKMHTPVTVLNVTSLSNYRPDGHVFNWTGDRRHMDCTHWCLPGVPDTWNELLYASLLLRGRGVWS